MSLYPEKSSSLYFLQKEIWPLPHLFCVWEQIICIKHGQGSSNLKHNSVCYKSISMQHFQHKKKASKQFLVGAGQLPAVAVSEGAILKYHGSSADNEYRWLSMPFPNYSCNSSSFSGCKTALWQVCDEGAPSPVTSTVGTRAR